MIYEGLTRHDANKFNGATFREMLRPMMGETSLET